MCAGGRKNDHVIAQGGVVIGLIEGGHVQGRDEVAIKLMQGGLLVIPPGLIAGMKRKPIPTFSTPVDTQVSAARARAVVMEIGRSLGFDPTDRELEKLGYDIESRIPGTGCLRFIEVKGRVTGASTITVTRNEILYSFARWASTREDQHGGKVRRLSL